MATLPDISEHLHVKQRYCYPDWEAIDEVIETDCEETEFHEAWVTAARSWIECMCQQLGGKYQVHETENFIVLSAAHPPVIRELRKKFEHALKQIYASFEGLPCDLRYGKHVVLMFSTLHDYYGYIDHFYPDGNHPMSGGIYLERDSYRHMAIPAIDDDIYLTTLVHELTHSHLRPFPLPLWLNEALAMRMEILLCDSAIFHLDKERYDKHLAHWNEETIQQFWTGESWCIAGESVALSYNLAQILWRKIEVDLSVTREEMHQLILKAHFDDAGESACQAVFKIGLGELVADFLGDGNWAPCLSLESLE